MKTECNLPSLRYNADPVSQVHLLLGPNMFALSEERRRWMRSFREKHGDENLLRFDAEAINYRELANEAATAPFIAEKRLIVIDGVPKGKKGEAAALVESLHSATILLFSLETELGRHVKFTVIQKEIQQLAECREFPSLSQHQIANWMDAVFREKGGSASAAARALLLNLIGEDQQMLLQEISKMVLYARGREISPEDVRALAGCSVERESWALMDMLCDGRSDDAILYVRGLLERGYSPHGLWNTFLWMVSFIVQVVAYVDDGETNAASIARDLHARHSTVHSVLRFARQADRAKLRAIVERVVEVDHGLKTGRYRSSGESPEELLSLIDRSLLAFA